MGTQQWDMAKIRAANKKSGQRFFDASVMRSFNSRIEPDVFEGPGGVFFVSSERFTSRKGLFEPRVWTVREFNPSDGHCWTAFDHSYQRHSYLSKLRAQKVAKCLASKWDLTFPPQYLKVRFTGESRLRQVRVTYLGTAVFPTWPDFGNTPAQVALVLDERCEDPRDVCEHLVVLHPEYGWVSVGPYDGENFTPELDLQTLSESV